MSNPIETPALSLAEFVIQEAKEKVFEIEIKSLKQFEKDKEAIVQRDVAVIKEDFEKKMRVKEMEVKIVHSTVVNKCRLNKMEARNRCMMKIFGEVQFKISKLIRSDNEIHKKILHKLLIQGFIKLMEPEVVVRCLQRDIGIVESLLDNAKNEFVELVKVEMKKDFSLTVSVSKDQYLEERALTDNSNVDVESYYESVSGEIIAKSEEDKKCFGGILLTDKQGVIVCKNTFDVRVDLCFQESLPDIRKLLF